MHRLIIKQLLKLCNREEITIKKASYVGIKILEKLNEVNKNQTWLSKQCGVTKSQISRIISGRSQPLLKLLQKISMFLSIELDILINLMNEDYNAKRGA